MMMLMNDETSNDDDELFRISCNFPSFVISDSLIAKRPEMSVFKFLI